VDFSTLVTSIASQGLLGAILLIALWVAWSKDRELKAEREARITDAKSYTAAALTMQAQVIDAVHKLANILEEMTKMVSGRPPGFGGDR
jgi:hypothetical protein